MQVWREPRVCRPIWRRRRSVTLGFPQGVYSAILGVSAGQLDSYAYMNSMPGAPKRLVVAGRQGSGAGETAKRGALGAEHTRDRVLSSSHCNNIEICEPSLPNSSATYAFSVEHERLGQISAILVGDDATAHHLSVEGRERAHNRRITCNVTRQIEYGRRAWENEGESGVSGGFRAGGPRSPGTLGEKGKGQNANHFHWTAHESPLGNPPRPRKLPRAL